MTVVAKGGGAKGSWFEVEAGAETLQLTTVAQWKVGKKINLERALKIGDELGGHIVTGHVDGVAKVALRENLGDMARIRMRAPKALSRFIAAKGSVALDGISLTVNEVKGEEFGVFRSENLGDMARIRMRAPKALSRFIAAKGSVALDGISLTVNEVKGEEFGVF